MLAASGISYCVPCVLNVAKLVLASSYVANESFLSQLSNILDWIYAFAVKSAVESTTTSEYGETELRQF